MIKNLKANYTVLSNKNVGTVKLKVRNVSNPHEGINGEQRIVNFFAIRKDDIQNIIDNAENGEVSVEYINNISYAVEATNNNGEPNSLYAKLDSLMREQEINCTLKMYTRTTVENAQPKLTITGIGIPEVKSAIGDTSAWDAFEDEVIETEEMVEEEV